VVPKSGPWGVEECKAPVECYTCGQVGHYSTSCPRGPRKLEGFRNPVRNFALQEEVSEDNLDKPQEDPAVKSEEPEGETPPVEVVDDDYIGCGDQYDLDEFFILEELEEADNGEQVAGIHELEEDEILCTWEVLVGHVDDRPYQVHVHKNQMGMCPRGATEARQCLATYITINGVKAYMLFDSRSTPDLMSPDFAWVMKVSMIQLENPVPIQLSCIGS
jgi:Zinc knuckle